MSSGVVLEVSAQDVSIVLESDALELEVGSLLIDILTVPTMDSMEIITTGPQGPTGIVKVTHGSNPNVARPTATIVYWVGTVQPVNALPDDLLMLK